MPYGTIAADRITGTNGNTFSPESSVFRNRIINGAMVIDQRNAGASVTPATFPTYLTDRFAYNASVASKLTFQQVTDAPSGFKNSLKITVAAQYSPAVSERFIAYQKIEGFNVADLQFGTAGALTITTSQYIKGSVAGTYAVSINNAALDRSYVGTVSVTTSWQPLSITLQGDTTGTWATDNTTGLQLTFDLGSGSNFNTTANAWQAGTYFRTAGSVTFVNQTAGSTLNITGVQLEVGSQATSFDYRPYGTELALCQRYYQKFSWTDSNLITAQAASTSSAFGAPVYFVQEMRASPTITLPTAGSSSGNATFLTSTGGYPSTIGTVTTEAIRTTGFSIKCSGYTSGFTAGNATSYYAVGTATITMSSEL